MLNNKEKAADYFKRHDGTECYITSDGRVFHSIGVAESYAVALKDSNVESFKRESTEKGEITKGADKPKNDKKVFETLELTEENISQILDFGLVKENYMNLKALANHLKLQTENQKADTLIKVLSEYKLKNQE